MKKTWAAFALSLMTAITGLGCSTDRAAVHGDKVTTLRYQSSAGMVTLPELAADLGYFEDLKLDYVGTVQGGPQDLLTLVAGDVDFAAAFNGAVIKVIASGLDVVPVVASYGSDFKQSAGFYVLENSPIRSARDFIGKKVAMNTFGAHHDFVLRDYLKQAGLTEAEIAQVQMIMLPPISAEQALRHQHIDVAVLSHILEQRALKNGGVRKVFADVDLYGEFTAGSYAMRKDFIEKYPAAHHTFVQGIAKAHHWVQTTSTAEIQARFSRIIQQRGRNESLALVPYFQGYGVHAKGGVQSAQDFAPWIEQLEHAKKLAPNQIQAQHVFSNVANPYLKEHQF